MRLRPYQDAALEAVRTSRLARGIVACPTGTGKSVLAGRIPGVLGIDRVLYLAHREELIAQLADHVYRASGTHPGVERAEHRAAPMDRVVVASVPTLAANGARRLAAIDPGRFGLIIVDEAHHGTATSYLKVWQHFGLLNDQKHKTASPTTRLIGLTATPGRGDNVGLDNVFDGIVYQYKLLDAIRDGYLAPIHAYTYRTGTDLSAVKVRRGDYSEKELAEACNTEDRNAEIVAAWRQFANGKRTLVFAVDVAHSRALADAFNAAGIRADSVDGSMDSVTRAMKLDAIRTGTIDVLVNVAIASEGTDIPQIECVLMARPTKSPTLYAQQLGRGTRLAPGAHDITESIALGKDRCIVIDVTDSTETAGRRAVRIGDIVGLPLPEEPIDGEDVLAAMARQESILASSTPRATKTGAFDLFAATVEPPKFCQLSWVGIGDALYLNLGERQLRAQENLLGHWYVEGRSKKSGGWVPVGEPEPSLNKLMARVEPWVRQRMPDEAKLVSRHARWRGGAPTEKQVAYAVSLGIDVPEDATRGWVSSMINARKAQRQAVRG